MDDLFKIIDHSSSNDYDAVFSILLKQKHPIFAGHFPGQAILPGACLLFITKRLAEVAVKGKLELDECLSAKFTKLIHPDGQPIPINLNIKNSEPGKYLIVGKVGNEETFARLKLMMTLA